MATKVFLRTTSTVVNNNAALSNTNDLLSVAGSGASINSTLFVSPADANERIISKSSSGSAKFAFWSERVAAEVTISGDITVNAWAGVNATGDPARLRFRISKYTTGGAYTETIIAQGDETTNLPVVASSVAVVLRTLTLTPPVPVTVAPNERLVLRVSAFRADLTAPTNTIWFDYNSGTAGAFGDAFVTFTETITWTPNDQQMFFRRTNVAGISTHLDLLPTRGSSSFTTGVVNTATQSNGVFTTPWTRTAGGTVLTFVSPRLKANWTPSSGNYLGSISKISGKESSLSANAGLKVRIYRLTPAGVETEIFNSNVGTEFTTSDAIYAYTYTFIAAAAFEEDDRILVRIYLLAVGAMTTGFTATFDYDHNVLDAAGDSYLTFRELPGFKAESDPGKARITDGLSTSGIGN